MFFTVSINALISWADITGGSLLDERGLDNRRNYIRALQHMAAKETNTLSGHLTFYPAASECLSQVNQIFHYHIFCKILRTYLAVIDKKIT
jgi:hypothetical protein